MPKTGYLPLTRVMVALLTTLAVACSTDEGAANDTGQIDSGSSTPFTQLLFTKDYEAGSYDISGKWMGGTETNYIVPYKGKLFATVSYWNIDLDGPDPIPGPTVLIKERHDAPWRVEQHFGDKNMRSEMMAVLTFTTDGEGKKLPQPVQLLAAGVGQRRAPVTATIWTRDDTSGKWARIVLDEEPTWLDSDTQNPGVRFLIDHVDSVTGVHHVFAGTSAGKVFRGVYDPAAPGRLRFERQWELQGPRRVYSMCEFQGKLHADIEIDAERAGGGLYVRHDGPQPSWELVYDWEVLPNDGEQAPQGALRGLMQVGDPNDAQKEVILGAKESPGIVERIYPNEGYRVDVELDVKDMYATEWQGLGGKASIIAYNAFTPVTHPDTGELVHLAGLWINHPERLMPPHNGSYFLVRHLDGTYEQGHVFDYDSPVPIGEELRGTRTIAVSPFPEDEGRVLYFGGFDAISSEPWSWQSTAWIYRAVLPR